VVFLDIVEYSKKVVAEQIAMKERLNTGIAEAIKHVSTDDRILLDTGDGAALCFLSDPEEALFAALSLRDTFASQAAPELTDIDVRIGVNLGPVRVVRDINDQLNVLGDGINVAQRVMNFARPNQVLVSRSFYEVISRVSQEYAQLFHYRGLHKDKHIREHEVYEVMLAPPEQAGPCRGGVDIGDPVMLVASNTTIRSLDQPLPTPAWDREVLTTAEQHLARYIGPLAKLLVQRAARTTADLQALYAILANAIPDEKERQQFLKTAPRSRPSLLPPDPISAPPAAPQAPLLTGLAAEAEQTAWKPATLQTAILHLAHYLGPIATLLVRREAPNAPDLGALYQRLARHIADEQERQQFLETAPLPPAPPSA
jgi:hypothetical protein